MRSLAALPLTFLLLAGSASQPTSAPTAPAKSGRQCFSAIQINSFTGTRDNNVDVRVGPNRYFRLELGAGCPTISWSTAAAIRTRNGGSYICEGYDAELIAPDPAFTQRCPVVAIHAISKEQWLADNAN